jgi:CheY-like chemotaxis protein
VSGPLVMVVEDDADTRELIVEVLRDDGYTVVAAGNGAEALTTARSMSQSPAIILLDLMMPVMSGWEFLEARTGETTLAEVPVLVLSADPARNLASQHRVAAVIGKPFDLPRLLKLVRAVTKAQAEPLKS